MKRLIGVGLLLLLMSACAGTTEPLEESSSPTTAGSPERFEFTGQGQTNTDPFTLAGGRYVSTWLAGEECYYAAALVPVSTGGPGSMDLGSGDGPTEGRTNLYDVEAGEYFVRMITGPVPSCPWSVVISTP